MRKWLAGAIGVLVLAGATRAAPPPRVDQLPMEVSYYSVHLDGRFRATEGGTGGRWYQSARVAVWARPADEAAAVGVMDALGAAWREFPAADLHAVTVYLVAPDWQRPGSRENARRLWDDGNVEPGPMGFPWYARKVWAKTLQDEGIEGDRVGPAYRGEPLVPPDHSGATVWTEARPQFQEANRTLPAGSGSR